MQQLQDDVLYALDGLKPGCGLSTQQEAAVQLAEALATRRGRAALRWAIKELTMQLLPACCALSLSIIILSILSIVAITTFTAHSA